MMRGRRQYGRPELPDLGKCHQNGGRGDDDYYDDEDLAKHTQLCVDLPRPQVVLDIDLKTQCHHVAEDIDSPDEKPRDQCNEAQAENHQSKVPDSVGQIERIQGQSERHRHHDPANRTAKMTEQHIIHL
jgi:hypothetical protein